MKTISTEFQEKLIRILTDLQADIKGQDQYDDVMECLEELRPKRARRKPLTTTQN